MEFLSEIKLNRLTMINDLPGFTQANGYTAAIKKYIIFAGDGIESIWTNYFDRHYEEFSALCKENDFKFIYLKEYFFDQDNILCHEDKENAFLFNIPDSKNKFKLSYNKLKTDNPLLGHIVNNLVSYPALIYYEGYDSEYFYFLEYRLPVTNEINYKQILNSYIHTIKAETNTYISKEDTKACTGMVLSTLRDLDKAIEKLRLFGLTRSVINQAIGSFRHLSHLIITTDNRIILPFFDVEIKMSPLPKAVYFLFLRHPEGIVFKNMTNYKDELNQIYLMISPAENIQNISRSIEKLCNPLDNSLNEKCSRIKEAFLKYFEEDLASIYYVTGNAKEKRFILFDRDFVHWNVHWSTDDKNIDKYFIPIITTPNTIYNLLKDNIVV